MRRSSTNRLFLKAWNNRVVCHDLSEKQAKIRNHPLVGPLSIYTVDMSVWANPDLFLRTAIPADAESVAKFERLAGLAQSRTGLRSTAYAYA